MDVIEADFHDFAPELQEFENAVLTGLGGTPKTLPSKFFYDQRGARLFERICTLPEYYPTRTETALLRQVGGEIARRIGPSCRLVDFGAGSSLKARLLLAALDRPQAYIPVDISGEQLRQSATAIARAFPGLTVTAICADYTLPFALPAPAGGTGFFPGSTIGNFTPAEAEDFLSSARESLAGGPMIVGVDRRKSEALLHAAYNDAAGVTAAFNLNLLVRINRELEGDFDLDRFRHHAFYDRAEGRVEMHLESLVSQTVQVAGRHFAFARGETIHTENSYKYTVEGFGALAAGAGFEAAAVWSDPQDLFSIFYLEPSR